MSRLPFIMGASALLGFVASAGASGQSSARDSVSQTANLAFAERVAVRALRFSRGDASSFVVSKPEFTNSGWTAFMKHFNGFVDGNGAPQFSSSFTPVGPAVVVGEKDGVLQLRIPGKLEHSNGTSKTTYRSAVNVEVGGTPLKVQRLDWNTCVGEAARTYCM